MSKPASVTGLILSEVALSLLGLVAVVATWVLRDDLVRSWAEGRGDSLRELLATGGLEALRESGTEPPAFVPVAVVLFVVMVMLVWVLGAFTRLGYEWARVVLTGSLVFAAIGTVAGILTGPPDTFVALAVVSFVLEAVLLVFLWHPQTTAYLHGTWQAEDADRRAPSV